jgi:hypothetical protein
VGVKKFARESYRRRDFALSFLSDRYADSVEASPAVSRRQDKMVIYLEMATAIDPAPTITVSDILSNIIQDDLPKSAATSLTLYTKLINAPFCACQ